MTPAWPPREQFVMFRRHPAHRLDADDADQLAV
jgi:hypothetical protein